MTYTGPSKPALLTLILDYNDHHPTDIIKLKATTTLTQDDMTAARKILDDRLATRTKYPYNDLQLQAQKLQGFCTEILNLAGFKSYAEFRWKELSVCMREMSSAIEGKWGETYERFRELKRVEKERLGKEKEKEKEKEKRDEDMAKGERGRAMKADADLGAEVEQEKIAEEIQKKLDKIRRQREVKDMEEQRKLDELSTNRMPRPAADQRRHTAPQMTRTKKSLENLRNESSSPNPPSAQLHHQKKSLEDPTVLAASPTPTPRPTVSPPPKAMSPQPQKNIESLFEQLAIPKNASPLLPPRKSKSIEDSRNHGSAAVPDGPALQKRNESVGYLSQAATTILTKTLSAVEPFRKKSTRNLRQNLATMAEQPTGTPAPTLPARKKSVEDLRQTATPTPPNTLPPALQASKKSTENSQQPTIASPIPGPPPTTSHPIPQAKNKSILSSKQTASPIPPIPRTPLPPALQKRKKSIESMKKVTFANPGSTASQEVQDSSKPATQMPGEWKDEADMVPVRKKGRGVEDHKPKMERAHYEALRLASEIGKFSWPPVLEKGDKGREQT